MIAPFSLVHMYAVDALRRKMEATTPWLAVSFSCHIMDKAQTSTHMVTR